ncbi:molybdenum cofactor biosynthesis protein MoaE [Candidatus Hecatella orcuttiae]|uniref:molybdenum cofactor biosynthesis protein MoaE n=1 Tax=Candidatus Hecatella orcuttiae TaxID=1935119 RepID=UPI0028681498|nr:molybdenum cofactor biosynthesis protein MoaE [Candidatus Hecatella orcuttiae]
MLLTEVETLGWVGIHKKGEISVEKMLEKLRENPRFHEVGAIGIFIGIVRGFSSEGKPVRSLSYEAYEDEAPAAMEKIRKETLAKPSVIEVQIHHVVDDLNLGEDIVYVLVAGSSREDVFPTLQATVDRMKAEVPIYKKEILENGTAYWVSEAGFRLRGRS